MMKRIAFICLMFAAAQSAACAQTADDLAREYYKKGNMLYQQGRFKEAQDEYNKAMEVLKNRDATAAAEAPAPAAPAAPRPAAVVPVTPMASATEYVIGDDDVLHIAVWQNEDLNLEVVVRPDGKISFPLIGDVAARGMTITQLDEEITRRLSEYVRSPEISISLRKIGGSKVILLGEIQKPGVYSMAGQKTLLEAIGLAGGFTRDSVPSSIILIRGGLVNPSAQRINLSKALKGRDFLRQNIVLQAEDVVFVPKKFIADVNYFLGLIVDPLSKGAYIKDQYRGDW
ncbi:MAG: polysaccharide biosynthesis/export family protein [Candidatus Omnitrophica bacterium]|nr:polysaccharide biosynthesis/export family protein [Candidatus Omnitrophota bacterium]